MDCIKFFQTICIFAIPFFVSIYCIVEFQPDYYKYPKEDIKELKLAIIVAGIIHIVASIALTLWKARRNQAKRQLIQVQDSNAQKQGNINNYDDEFSK